MFKKTRTYLDYAAATPLSKTVLAAMRPFLTTSFANASAIHQEGAIARRAVDEARERAARALQVRPECITFTSGGTESNNLAILGTVEHLANQGRSLVDMEVITTKIEHPSVMNTMRALEARGVVVRYVGVDTEGFVVLSELQTLLSEKTVLFSVAYANSEIGVVQKTHAIKKVLTAAEKKFGSTPVVPPKKYQAPSLVVNEFPLPLPSLSAGSTILWNSELGSY